MSSPGSRPVSPAAASQLNLRGAVDLSSLRRPATPPPAAPAPAGPGASAGSGQGDGTQDAGAAKRPLRVDANEANFQDLVELSARIPVLFLLWARYSPESTTLLQNLEQVVESYDGRIVLAAADVEAFPQLADAFRIEAIPTAVAVLGGRPLPLFQGPAAEQEIRALLDELLKVAAENGVTGSVRSESSVPEEAPVPPLHQAAFDAIEAGDYAAAAQAYRQALAEQPADREAKAGLAQVELMGRLESITAPQAEELRRQAAQEPDNLDAQLAIADLDVSGGHIDDGFNRIITFIGRNFGPERETARVRLLELFDVVGVADERVAKARQGLARVLF
ncbi:co-chaperone YbbN [Arthrobacter sp. SW1]|uniref:tetratricopeptide repeat protein n=1 Tax=Arthrobacter sp. SW1 TaxID=1920889 RepID=UPI000877C445|nr:tetratricopeptide repeat protein [Arthrobacter sp. SW1]OFI39739.1 co-chaperone YbbN [Arthrobacter sp. SW1]